MIKIILISILLWAPLSLFSQADSSCDIIKMAYNDLVAKNFKRVYVAEKSTRFSVESNAFLVSSFEKQINKDILLNSLKTFDTEPNIYIETCLVQSYVAPLDSINKILRKGQQVELDLNNPLVKSVEQKIKNISDSAENHEEHTKMMSKLMRTAEYREYDVLRSFSTVRCIEFSKPFFFKQYCLLRIDFRKDLTDLKSSYFCLYKKKGEKWTLLKKVIYD